MAHTLDLRAHHLLCLLGYRELGYSREFIENMKEVSVAVSSKLLRIVDFCDIICAYCPYRNNDKCGKREDSAEKTTRQDQEVANRIGIKIGTELYLQEVWRAARGKIFPTDLYKICEGCEWLDLGYCADGLKKLNNTEINWLSH